MAYIKKLCGSRKKCKQCCVNILGENKDNVKGYSLNDKTKNSISRQVGLPFALLFLVDEDIENFIKHKNGKEITVPIGAKVDGVPVTSFEKKLAKKLINNILYKI